MREDVVKIGELAHRGSSLMYQKQIKKSLKLRENVLKLASRHIEEVL